MSEMISDPYLNIKQNQSISLRFHLVMEGESVEEYVAKRLKELHLKVIRALAIQRGQDCKEQSMEGEETDNDNNSNSS